MKKNITAIAKVIFSVALFLTFTIPVTAQGIISFTGDLQIKNRNTTTKAKLYAKGIYIRRVEMSKEAGGMIFISPKDARGKIWMLDPAKKQFKILSWPEIHEDPVSAWTDIQYDMGGGFIREDTLDGHPCAIYEFNYPGQEKIALKIWSADDIHYVIKQVAYNAKIAVEKDAEPKIITGTFQIKNIKVKELDNSLFEIPADYTEVK